MSDFKSRFAMLESSGERHDTLPKGVEAVEELDPFRKDVPPLQGELKAMQTKRWVDPGLDEEVEDWVEWERSPTARQEPQRILVEADGKQARRWKWFFIIVLLYFFFQSVVAHVEAVARSY